VRRLIVLLVALGGVAYWASSADAQLHVTPPIDLSAAVPHASDVAYDQAHDAFVLADVKPQVKVTFRSPAGAALAPAVTLDAAAADSLGVVSAANISDGNGGLGVFLVVWSRGNAIYARAVRYPGQLVGAPVAVFTDPQDTNYSVAVGYSPTDHLYLIAFGTCCTDWKPRFIRLDANSQPLGSANFIGAPPPTPVDPSRVMEVRWNPAVNEFAVLYGDPSMALARLRTDGTVVSRTTLSASGGPAALDLDPGSGHYMAVWTAPGGTNASEVDAAGNVVGQKFLTNNLKMEPMALSFSPASGTYLVAGTSFNADDIPTALELDRHGNLLPPQVFPWCCWVAPRIANRTGTAAWFIDNDGWRAHVITTDTGVPLPAATTSDATNVAMTSATLNGIVNPNGLATTAYFEYGITTSYGKTTPSANVGDGTSGAAISQLVSALACGAVYHFRIVATNSAGTKTGTDHTFTTTACTLPWIRGDMTGDGRADLIWQDPATGSVLLWGMDGVSYGASKSLFSGTTSWRIVAVADFSGDGKPDLVWQEPYNNSVLLWEMDGTNYVRETFLFSGSTSWRVVAAADFTGDGKPDLVWQEPYNNNVLLWEMNGTSYVRESFLFSGSTSWRVVGAADFTGDGKPDLLWQEPYTNTVLLWEMNGTSYVRETFVLSSPTSWQVAAVADFNGDDKPDIVWQEPYNNAVLLWEMNGTSYVRESLLFAGGTSWQVKGPR